RFSEVQRFSLLSRQEHDSFQAGMAQEKRRVLHLVPKENRRLTPTRIGGGSQSPLPQ
ncbi:mCG144978, partial [Mus musculus]